MPVSDACLKLQLVCASCCQAFSKTNQDEPNPARGSDRPQTPAEHHDALVAYFKKLETWGLKLKGVYVCVCTHVSVCVRM